MDCLGLAGSKPMTPAPPKVGLPCPVLEPKPVDEEPLEDVLPLEAGVLPEALPELSDEPDELSDELVEFDELLDEPLAPEEV